MYAKCKFYFYFQALAAIAQNANILKIKPVASIAPQRNYHDLSNAPITHPSQLFNSNLSNPSSANSTRRKRSQRSSVTTSNPNTPTDGSFPALLFNDPNVSGLPKAATTTCYQSTNPFHTSTYSNSSNSKPSTPTDPNFPIGQMIPGQMSSFRSSANEIRPLSTLQAPPQNVGAPVMPNHSRISSHCSSNSGGSHPANRNNNYHKPNHNNMNGFHNKSNYNNQNNNSNYQFVNGLPTPNQSNEFLPQLISQSNPMPNFNHQGTNEYQHVPSNGSVTDSQRDFYNHNNGRLNGRPSSRNETTV